MSTQDSQFKPASRATSGAPRSPGAAILLAATFAALLTACGGGGGGGSTPAPPPAPAPPAPPPAPVLVVPLTGNLQPTPPALTYAASSYELPLINRFNEIRVRAGAGPLIQSAQMDTAAAGHWNWGALSGTASHIQPVGSAGFTGATVADRIRAAGFTASKSSEGIFGFPFPDQAKYCMGTGLPYHLQDAFYGWTHVGMRSDDLSKVPGPYTPFPGAFGCVNVYAMVDTKQIGQVPATGALITYPFDGGFGMFRVNVDGEVPRPPRSVLPNTFIGAPVFISVRNADFINWQADGSLDVTITQLELKDAAGNIVPVGTLSNPMLKAGPGVVLNADTIMKDGSIVMTPLSPLTLGQVYRVNFSATLKPGAPALTKTWTFTANETGS